MTKPRKTADGKRRKKKSIQAKVEKLPTAQIRRIQLVLNHELMSRIEQTESERLLSAIDNAVSAPDPSELDRALDELAYLMKLRRRASRRAG